MTSIQPSIQLPTLGVGDYTFNSYVIPTSPSWTNQVCIAVANPDGSNIIGGATIDISALTGDQTNNNAAPSNTNIGVLPAIANAAAPSYTEGYQVLLSTNLSGSLRTLLTAALPAGTNVIGHVIIDSSALPTGAATATNQTTLITNTNAYTYQNIPTSTTTLVKSGAGTLGLVALNTAGVTSTAILYDGLDATGVLIATINTTVTGSSVVYNTSFATGLCVVTAGGSAADITVMYK